MSVEWWGHPPASFRSEFELALRMVAACHRLPTPNVHRCYKHLYQFDGPEYLVRVRELTVGPGSYEIGEFEPSMRAAFWRKAETIGATIRILPPMRFSHQNSILPTILHEIGHVVDREVVGRGRFFASKSQYFTPPAKTIKLICRQIRNSNEFLQWQGHYRELTLFVNAWDDPDIQDELTEADRSEASRLKRKRAVAERYCAITEWFANEYSRHIIDLSFDRGVITNAQHQDFLSSYLHEEELLWRNHFRGSQTAHCANVLIRSDLGQMRLSRYFATLFEQLELA